MILRTLIGSASCVLVASVALAAGPKLSDLKGPATHCGATLYSWPESADSPPTEFGTASLTLAGDGKGTWTSGTLRLVVQEGQAEEKTCDFRLKSGKFVPSHGGARSTITWSSVNDEACAALIAPYVSGSMTAPTKLVSVVDTYPNASGQLFQLSFGPAGFVAGTCDVQRQ